MKTLTITLVSILVLSLICISDASVRKRRSNNALREQLLDYLLEAQRRELLYNDNTELEEETERRGGNFFSDSTDEDEKTYVRRKAVGLSDNPFK